MRVWPTFASGCGGGQGQPAVTRTRNLSFPKRDFFALVGTLCSALKPALKLGAHFCEICGMGTVTTPPPGGPQIASQGQTGGEADGSRPRAFYQQRADYAGSRSAAEPYICSIRLVPLLFMTGGGDKFNEGVSGLLFRIVHELDRIVRRFSRLPSAAEYGILFLENLAAG